ncbi:MAG: S8 family serine peptidase [Winogradskyella sp.]|uniref:S8 family serine peptidase n=1 Tax=Winogradskyella sp. TaxID=1883156 RepID=UPI00385D17F1
MKNFIFLCFIVLISNAALAQEMSKEQFNSLSEENKTLYNRLVIEHIEREARVNAYLLSKGVKRRHVNADGSEFEIRDIINGHPIYYATDNTEAAIATKTNQLQVGGALGLDLDGSGMTVGVWDGGPVQSSHPEFAIPPISSRVLGIDSETPDGDSGFSNHGTHVAGTIGASGVDPLAKGMATAVEIKSYGWINDYSEMITAATDINNPIYLSNHSYGVPVSTYVDTSSEEVMGAYIQDSRTIDEIVYNNPKYLPVLSAGNSGNTTYSGQNFPGLDKLTGDKTGKNNLIIANANPFVSGGIVVNLTINSSSSQGPTDDLRIKPDIAADGTNVYSPTTGNSYSTFSGTSMAAPNTTGTLVLLQQYYSQLNGGVFMDASTLKAIVCHTAVDDNAKAGPDARFGWGFLDAKASAEVIGGANTNEAVLEELTLSNNGTYTYTFSSDAGSKLSATICWTDVPGAVSSGTLNDPTPALVNDLDLRITKDGTTFLPWKLSLSPIGGLANTKGDNVVDNVERIDIDTPEAGEYTLTVTHKGTLQGVANNQNFSLVVTGNNLTLGVDENNLSRSLKLFPNPNNGEFTISFDSNATSDVKLDIYDISGRTVYNNSFVNSSQQFNETIDLKGLQSGVYIVNITEGNKTSSHKMIIE